MPCLHHIPLPLIQQQAIWNLKAISSPRHNVNLDITNRHQSIMFFLVHPYSIWVHNLLLLFSDYLLPVLSTKILCLYNIILYQGMENTLISLTSHKMPEHNKYRATFRILPLMKNVRFQNGLHKCHHLHL